MRRPRDRAEIAGWIFKLGAFGLPAFWCLFVFRGDMEPRAIASKLAIVVSAGVILGAVGAGIYLFCKR